MDESVSKFKIIRNILFLIFIILIIAAVRLQIFEGSKYARLSEKNRIRPTYVPAPRGRILDRYGIELANTRPGFYVSVIQSLVDEKTITNLIEILDIERSVVEERMKLQKNPFMPVKIAHDISYEQLSIIEERMDDFTGIEVAVEPLRNYPYGDVFSHVLGYVGEIAQDEIKTYDGYSVNDYVGRMGLEQRYEQVLRGCNGIEYIEVDARGRKIGTIVEKRPVLFECGKDLYTTLDQALSESVAVFLEPHARGACICVDPETGEILVLYSKPGFDPNLFVHGLRREEWLILNTTPDAPMYNRAIMSCYPAGSTFKPFVALTGLATDIIDKNKRFSPCWGSYRLGRRTFRCWKKHGSRNLTEAIVQSCDIYFYQLGSLIGIDSIASFSERVGFGKSTGIDLPNEKSGSVPTRLWMEERYGKNWTEGHIFNISIGQGDLLVTPLQLACAFATFINGGYIPTPHIKQRSLPSLRSIGIPREILDIVSDALLKAVQSGTGQLARVPGRSVSGKTGTAQNPHGEDHSLFVGFTEDMVVCCIVENAGHGGSVAAPIVGKVFRAYYDLQNQRLHVQKN